MKNVWTAMPSNLSYLRMIWLAMGVLYFLAACSSKQSQSNAPAQPEPDSAYRGLAFITAPSFQSSALNFYDFKSGDLLTVLPGQAGDSWMTLQHELLFFFNRNKERSNFVMLDIQQKLATTSKEQATPGTSYGDPHAIYVLPNDLFILANNTSGHITLANYKTGEVRQTFANDTLDCGDICRPAAIIANKDESTFYIIHQGVDRTYKFNGKQALFVFSFSSENQLTPIDQNKNEEGIQGIPLKVSNPLSGSLTDVVNGEQKLQIIGTCTYFNLDGCTSGFEEVNITKQMSTMQYDTTDSPFKGNGAIVAGETPDVFYAAMAKETKEAFIVRIDIGQKAMDAIHSFPAHSSGFGLLAYDNSTNKLYIGDTSETQEGLLQNLLLDNVDEFIEGRIAELPTQKFELPFPPTQGVFIP